LFVPHVVESVERIDRNLQDAVGHLRLDEAGLVEVVPVRPEHAVQRCASVEFEALGRTELANVFRQERMQPVKSSFRLVVLDGIAYGLSQGLDRAVVRVDGNGVDVSDSWGPQQTLNDGFRL